MTGVQSFTKTIVTANVAVLKQKKKKKNSKDNENEKKENLTRHTAY